MNELWIVRFVRKDGNPSALHSCRNVGDLFERADRPDR